jgi:hypothetical protein
MSLKKIDTCNVNAYFTESSKVDMFIYDKLKKIGGNSLSTIITVNTAKDFNEVISLANVLPHEADKWLFVLNYSKVSGLLKKHKGVLKSDTSSFIVKLANYKEFLNFNKEHSDGNINSMYLSRFSKDDFYHVLSGKGLSDDTLSFIWTSYYNDIDKFFDIAEHIDSGGTLKTRKDVSDLCGVSATSLQGLSFMLLRDLPKTAKGRKTSLKKVLNLSLLTAEGFGFTKAYYYLLGCLKDFLDIKMLVMQGVVYDRIFEVPQGFDENRLKKNNRYLKSIGRIPYNKLAGVYLLLNSVGVWRNEKDVTSFIYKLYSREGCFDINT